MSDLTSPPVLPKRFYESVSIEEEGEDFQVRLDGRPIRTPARTVFALPSRMLAEISAAEWNAQRDVIDPRTMPMTRLVNTIIDGVAPNAAMTVADLERYAETDLLAYRADEPERLVARQEAGWDPVLDWVRRRYGVEFATQAGVMHVRQPDRTVATLREAVRGETDPFRLAALHQITTLTGSLVLALAVAQARLTAEEAWRLAHLDEDWNIELWGEDKEARERRDARFGDMSVAAEILAQIPANHS